jgi:hypothetical protein
VVGTGHGVRRKEGRLLFERSTLEVVGAAEVVVAGMPGEHSPSVRRSSASSESTFGAGDLTLQRRRRTTLWLAFGVLAVTRSGDYMSFSEGFFRETPEGALLWALQRSSGNALEGLGISISYHAGGGR